MSPLLVLHTILPGYLLPSWYYYCCLYCSRERGCVYVYDMYAVWYDITASESEFLFFFCKWISVFPFLPPVHCHHESTTSTGAVLLWCEQVVCLRLLPTLVYTAAAARHPLYVLIVIVQPQNNHTYVYARGHSLLLPPGTLLRCECMLVKQSSASIKTYRVVRLSSLRGLAGHAEFRTVEYHYVRKYKDCLNCNIK